MPTRAEFEPGRRLRPRGAIALWALWALAIAGCGPRTAPHAAAASSSTGGLQSRTQVQVTPPPAVRPKVDVAVPPWRVALQLMDRDGDGRVSLAEHASAVEGMFTRMDHDGDGRVTVDEMAVVRGTLPDAADTARELHAVDANGDGVLDRGEHAAATRIEFDVMDTNHDGYLSAAELQAADPAAR